MPTKKGLKDEAKNNLSPILITGTPEELDQQFINIIKQPLQKATGLLTNMEKFEKSMEVALSLIHISGSRPSQFKSRLRSEEKSRCRAQSIHRQDEKSGYPVHREEIP